MCEVVGIQRDSVFAKIEKKQEIRDRSVISMLERSTLSVWGPTLDVRF